MDRILSGIQPSGALHLGNYIGAVRQWVELQDHYQAYFCIVDYHAITIRPDPEALTQNSYSLASMYLALGLDPTRAVLFKQSDVSAHTELAWILNTFAYMGELERMTQYKDKAKQHKQNNNVGLFTYPVLMAADILLYQPKLVPVGEDQKQHVELTRELAERFNNLYGETFIVPEYREAPQGARIMALDEPTKKMSKSATTEWGYISLTDTPDVVTKKIKRAVTSSDAVFNPQAAGVQNLLTIESVITGKSVEQLTELHANQGYGKFKTELAEAIVSWLEPIQAKYNGYMDDIASLQRVLADGAARASQQANQTLNDVKAKIGVR